MKNTKDELLDLVNKNDNIIGTVWKSDAHGDPTKIHREIAIAVFNDKGETLLQQRSLSKRFDPGVWQVTAAGHVGANEDPVAAATREVKEEVGIEIKPVFVRKELISDDMEARYFYVYYAMVAGRPKLRFNTVEVMNVVWIKPADVDGFVNTKGSKLDWKSKEFITDLAKKLLSVGI